MTISNGNADKLYNELRWNLNEQEPCRKAMLGLDRNNDVEKWTGNWVNSTTPDVALALCAGCHVFDMCREYAIVGEETSGIWGGTTPAQRKDELASRRRAKKISARFTKDTNDTDKAA